jgi:hypothetical protein
MHTAEINYLHITVSIILNKKKKPLIAWVRPRNVKKIPISLVGIAIWFPAQSFHR